MECVAGLKEGGVLVWGLRVEEDAGVGEEGWG